MAHPIQKVAHRGGSALAPQNTLAAFRNALALPIDAIELDVQMTGDGHVVVFHDNTVEKLTNGSGNMLELDFSYVRSLNAAAHFPGGWSEPQQIPTLREVLDLARGHAQVYIEIKFSEQNGVYGRYPNIAEVVVEEVRSTGMLDQVLIISFDWMILPVIKTLESTLQTGAIVSEDAWSPLADGALQTLVDHLTAVGCNWINVDCDILAHDMPEVAHNHGFKLGVWTANSIDEIRRCAEAGVDSITTDRPDLFSVLTM